MDLSEQSERMQSYYNLKHDPFGAIVDSMVFSGAGGRYETAETIRHLMTYSHQDSLLVAPPGSGKRTLGLQVLKLLDEQWRVAWIDGSDIESVSGLLKEIIGQFGLGLKLEEEPSELVMRIEDSVAKRYEEESFLIVVQYADRLPEQVRDILLSIRASASDIDSRIRQLWLSDHWEFLVSHLDEDDWYLHALERLSDTDAEQYLKDRLVASGNVNDLPIPAKDIARLNQLAEGNPSQLNESARDYLISSTFKTTEKSQKFPLTHVFAGVAALSLVVIAVLYQTTEKSTEVDVVPVVKSLDSMTSVEKKLAEAVAKVEAKQSDNSESSQDDAIADDNEDPISLVDDSALEVIAETTPLDESTAVSEVQEVQENAGLDDSQSVDTIDAGSGVFALAADDEFTMQLIGVRERAKLEEITTSLANSSQFDIVETLHQDKPWYILIYGRFSSKEQAVAAVSELPAEIGVSEPWIRAFSSIRAQQ
jgi:septal ring-binding cell division protein DamX